MADSTQSRPGPSPGDIFKTHMQSAQKIEVSPKINTAAQEQLLRSIDQGIQMLVKQTSQISQSAASDMRSAGRGPSSTTSNRTGSNNSASDDSTSSGGQQKKKVQSTGNILDDFFGEMENQLWESVLGSDFKEKMQGSLQNFADVLGVQVDEIPGTLGKELGNKVTGAIKNTPLGQKMFSGLDAASGKISQAAGGAFNKVFSGITAAGGSTGAAGAGAALSGLASTAASACPYILAAVAAVAIVDHALEKLGEAVAPAIEGFKEYAEAAKAAANQAQAMQNQMLEAQKERMKKDQEAIVEAEFKIIEDAAQRVTDVWDAVMATVTQSQGYTKDNLQSLMSSYASRLQSAGLSSVVSAADITSNLEQVIEAGLSGTVAEEFSYIATVLSEAVPTENWFAYASDYATVAALALKSGMSQQEAIAFANSELESFASNVLYASRQLAGGFSTSLANASSLFASSVEIANTSKIGKASDISNVLTAVSAITDAISSDDIASSLVDAVVSAAIGGNSSEIVALRSLAGINASNTEFLQALASSPQELFANIFENLGKMQNMSNSNFMEVAEGLAGVFGISMQALSQVDFTYLADNVRNMQLNTNTLSENLSLLSSGETTSNADQMRMEEINRVMLEEGLAYVLDNEVARSIQEHMWEEQLANEIKENTFAVDLQGAGLSLLQGLSQTVDNIINFLNPFSWLNKLSNIVLTSVESSAQRADLKNILELGKVGDGNSKSLYNLTTTGQDLNLSTKYIERLGGFSLASGVRDFMNLQNALFNPTTTSMKVNSMLASGLQVALNGAVNSLIGGGSSSKVSSSYNWGTIAKSTSSTALLANRNNLLNYAPNALVANTSATQASADASLSKFQAMIDDIGKYVEENKTYDEWVGDARKYGISDIAKAIENAGTSENDLKASFTAQQAQKASEHEHQRELNEDAFWEHGTMHWTTFMPEHVEEVYRYNDIFVANQSAIINNQVAQLNNETTMITNQEALLSALYTNTVTLTRFFDKYREFYGAWIDYYVNHTAYSRDTLSASQAAAIQNAEKTEYGDAVLSLAEALTSNQVNLLDPTVQQNALLGKILLVLEGILQNTNSVSSNSRGGSIATTLSALGLGL